MSLNTSEQILGLIENSKNILITVPYDDYSGDCISSAVAFYNFLLEKKKSGSIDLILPQKPKKIYSFLSKIDEAVIGFNKIKRLVFDVSTKKTKVKEIDYAEEGENLKIYLTSAPSEIKPEEVTVYYDDYYDLIILFNAQDLNSLGEIFIKNAEFFHKTPIINIDFNLANERYGQVNLVDGKFNSLSELVFDFFESIDVLVSRDIANCIFAGLVFATKGFTNNKVTPSCLLLASKLIQLGAEREKVISNIYQTKSISLLKIWGQILSQMKYDENSKMAWSFVDVETEYIDNVGAKELIEEIISRSPQVEIIVLFHAISEDVIRVYVYSNNRHSSYGLIKGLAGKDKISGNDDLLCFEFSGVKEDSYINILETIKRNINKIIDR